jgi:hypothetical protein
VIAQAVSNLPGATATPADTQAHTMTTSPGFSHDGIVFMTGSVYKGCAQGTCEALFRSDDAGASWSRLWLNTYQAGRVLLSPAFPADPTVFLLSQNVGLLAGTTDSPGPTLLLPRVTAATIAPDSTPGKARIAAVTAAGVLETYTVGDPAPVPGPALPPNMAVSDMAFAGPGVVVISGYEAAVGAQGGASQQALLVTCPLAGTCGSPIVLSDDALAIRTTGAYGSPLLAYSQRHAYLSTDGGATFVRIAAAPATQELMAAGIGTSPAGKTRTLASYVDAATMRHTTAAYSDDLGATWTDATGNLATDGYALSAQVLDGGNLLLGLLADAGGHFALAESSGNGHWAAPRVS